MTCPALSHIARLKFSQMKDVTLKKTSVFVTSFMILEFPFCSCCKMIIKYLFSIPVNHFCVLLKSIRSLKLLFNLIFIKPICSRLVCIPIVCMSFETGSREGNLSLFLENSSLGDTLSNSSNVTQLSQLS